MIHPSEGVIGLHTKYLRYRGTDPPYEELYDLGGDPLEKHNLAGSSGHKDLLMKYRGKLEEYRNKVK